jgi:hypothetical protein
MRKLLERLEAEAMMTANLREASYPGNLGYTEMIQFYRVASVKEQGEMESYLSKGLFRHAWKLLQTVTKTKLAKPGARWAPRASAV